MIVISCSIPKSASTLLFEYTQQLIILSQRRNGQDALLELSMLDKIRGSGGFVDLIDYNTTKSLLRINRKHGPVVVKIHGPPNTYIPCLIKRGQAKATFIHRDPRDIILSAIDHCKRSRGTNQPVLQEFTSVQASIPHIKKLVEQALLWMESGLAYIVSYKDLLLEPASQLRRISSYLNLQITDEQISSIILKKNRNPNHLYNTGKLSRFQEEMTLEEIDLCAKELKNEILRLGYEI